MYKIIPLDVSNLQCYTVVQNLRLSSRLGRLFLGFNTVQKFQYLKYTGPGPRAAIIAISLSNLLEFSLCVAGRGIAYINQRGGGGLSYFTYILKRKSDLSISTLMFL
jgi:hypothetical protein